MNIIFTNDDGIYAAGPRALCRILESVRRRVAAAAAFAAAQEGIR